MKRGDRGYREAVVAGLFPETQDLYRLDGDEERPDPASHFQPDGVHGPSRVVNHHGFMWQDQTWKGLSLAEMIIYELHVGTFAPIGTFEGIKPRLSDLRELGVNAIEIMPIGQFPGRRNRGYDGVYPFVRG